MHYCQSNCLQSPDGNLEDQSEQTSTYHNMSRPNSCYYLLDKLERMNGSSMSVSHLACLRVILHVCESPCMSVSSCMHACESSCMSLTLERLGSVSTQKEMDEPMEQNLLWNKSGQENLPILEAALTKCTFWSEDFKCTFRSHYFFCGQLIIIMFRMNFL